MKALLAAAVSIAVLAATPALAESWKDQYKTIKFGILSGENEKDRIARYTRRLKNIWRTCSVLKSRSSPPVPMTV